MLIKHSRMQTRGKLTFVLWEGSLMIQNFPIFASNGVSKLTSSLRNLAKFLLNKSLWAVILPFCGSNIVPCWTVFRRLCFGRHFFKWISFIVYVEPWYIVIDFSVYIKERTAVFCVSTSNFCPYAPLNNDILFGNFIRKYIPWTCEE